MYISFFCFFFLFSFLSFFFFFVYPLIWSIFGSRLSIYSPVLKMATTWKEKENKVFSSYSYLPSIFLSFPFSFSFAGGLIGIMLIAPLLVNIHSSGMC